MQIKANIAVTFNDSHSFYWWLCIKFLPQFGENLMHYFPAIVPHRHTLWTVNCTCVRLLHVHFPLLFFWNENFPSIHFISFIITWITFGVWIWISSHVQHNFYLYNMCNASIQLNQSRCQVIWWRFGFMLPDINIKFNLRWVFYRCDITQKKLIFLLF